MKFGLAIRMIPGKARHYAPTYLAYRLRAMAVSVVPF